MLMSGRKAAQVSLHKLKEMPPRPKIQIK